MKNAFRFCTFEKKKSLFYFPLIDTFVWCRIWGWQVLLLILWRCCLTTFGFEKRFLLFSSIGVFFPCFQYCLLLTSFKQFDCEVPSRSFSKESFSWAPLSLPSLICRFRIFIQLGKMTSGSWPFVTQSLGESRHFNFCLSTCVWPIYSSLNSTLIALFMFSLARFLPLL